MDKDVVRVLNPGQGAALMAGLAAGLPASALASRLRRRLLIALAARGFMRIPRALPHPGFQLRNPFRERTIHLLQLSHQHPQLSILSCKLLIRWRPTHPTSITRSSPRSTRRAVKPQDQLSSYIGSSMHTPAHFESLVETARQGQVRPVVAATYELSEVHQAQADLAERRHVGKLVLVSDNHAGVDVIACSRPQVPR